MQRDLELLEIVKMSRPLVSFIMPTYNSGNWIKNSITSILDQNYNQIELLIIDDNSTDVTSQIIERFSRVDRRVKYYRTGKRTCNIAKLLNIGIKLSRGDIIARQDADDISLKNRISEQIKFLERKDIALIGTMFYILLPKDKLIKDGRKVKKLFSSFSCETVLPLHGTWMFKKSLVEKVGLYNEGFPFAQDFEYILRIKIRYKLEIINLPQYLYVWRLHNRNISVENRDKRNMYIEIAKEMYGIKGCEGGNQ